MSEYNKEKSFTITNLVPEESLTESLPSHWHSRFEKALELIHNNLSEPLNWQEIASHCHISSKHFLQMFRAVFNETPGQYQCRMRLKQAAYYLITDSDITVKDIAIKSGFSSSQALAKALKRELNISASKLRKKRYDMDESFAKRMESLLGHPAQQSERPQENSLASHLDFSLAHYAERYFFTTKINVNESHSVKQNWQLIAPEAAELRY